MTTSIPCGVKKGQKHHLGWYLPWLGMYRVEHHPAGDGPVEEWYMSREGSSYVPE